MLLNIHNYDTSDYPLDCALHNIHKEVTDKFEDELNETPP